MTNFNCFYLAWFEVQRKRGDPKLITNQDSHTKYGNKNQAEYLTAIFQNVPGTIIKRKDQELAIKSVLEKFKPGLLGIAEPSYDALKTMWFPGYRLVKGKLTGGKKFRLNLLVKTSLVDVSIESFTTDIPSVLVKVGDMKFLYFYREWRVDGREKTDKIEMQEERWDLFLSRSKKIGGKLFILGDANLCYERDQTAHQKRLGNMKDMMFDMLAEKGYAQLIREDTRHQGEQVGLLDHIYTKSIKYVAEVFNTNVHGFDHNAIGVTLRMDKPMFKSKIVTVRNLEKVDPDEFDQTWNQSNPHELFAERYDIDRMIEILEFKIHYCLDILAPVRRYKTQENYAPWVDRNLKAELKERKRLRKAAVNKTVDWSVYKLYNREVRSKLREAEDNYLKQFLDFSDEKTGWKRLKQVSGLEHNSDQQITLKINGQIETDPRVLAPYMNQYFIEKIQKITDEIPPDPVVSSEYAMEYMETKSPGHFEFKTVDYATIKKVIMKMNNVDSTGLDNIPVKVYKKFRKTLTPALAKIVNECISQNYYPQRWKNGVISPIQKKGDLQEVSNWRPVVLMPVVSRVLEGVMTKQLRYHLESRGLISSSQHAYRNHRGCLTLWRDLDTKVQKARDQGKAVACLQTDMTGAFNVVNAECLLPKMRLAGVGLNSCEMIRSYLTKRTNRVKVENFISDPLDVRTGSGEGTQISPLIWVIFTLDAAIVLNRVKKIIESRVHELRPAHISQQDAASFDLSDHTYADDTNSLIIADNNNKVMELMQVTEQEYSKYFKAQGLKESKGKQLHIMFTKKKDENEEFCLNGRKAEKSTRLLGVVVSENWTFDEHADQVVRRMMQRIPHIRAIRHSVSREVLLRVSDALIMSIFTFACDLTSQKRSIQKRIQKVQNCLLRVITNSDRLRSIESMLIETNWMNCNLTVRYFTIWGLTSLLKYRNSELSYRELNLEFSYRDRMETRSRHLHLHWKPRNASGNNSWLVLATAELNRLHLFMTNWAEEPEAKNDLKKTLKLKYPNKNIK